MNDELRSRIDALRRAGHYSQAAELYLEAGEPAMASQLYADVWQYDDAIRVACDADLYDIAYRHAVTSGDRDACARLLKELAHRPEQALRAAELAESKGRTVDAARLREAAGDLAAAAALYEQAGELFEAARAYESIGQHRKAGLLYEKRVREAPDDGEAALRLGRILAQFGRYDHAVRALQKAAEDPERTQAALRLMVACFAAQNLDEAAASCLDRLRRDQPDLPVTVPDFLEIAFGDRRGVLALAEKGEAAELLAGRYRVVRPLGAGGTGRVLLAYDGFYDREVAVKVLTVGAGSAGRDAYVRFAREARVAAGMAHPNVVEVYEFNPDGPFLVMEYMAGGTLEERLVGPDKAPHRLPLPVLRHVMLSVLDGLSAVHSRGVVHRDLKPANIFFSAGGAVKIGDFGVAHLADLGATLTGAMLGTLAYMAPEQITGSQRPDASTDLYALGIILFRCLSGRLPFPGPDFVQQHLQGSPPKLGELLPGWGDAFEPVVEHLLAKEPAKRARSALEVRAQLVEMQWPAEDEVGAVTVDQAAPAPISSTPPAPDSERYTKGAQLPSGGHLARDSLLGRVVRMEPCDGPRIELLRRMARADGPYLQAVFDLDAAHGEAVIESPVGASLTEVALTAPQWESVANHLGQALRRLHESGVAHGQVDGAHVVIGKGRAVLLLPDRLGGTPAGDQAALQALISGRGVQPA